MNIKKIKENFYDYSKKNSKIYKFFYVLVLFFITLLTIDYFLGSLLSRAWDIIINVFLFIIILLFILSELYLLIKTIKLSRFKTFFYFVLQVLIFIVMFKSSSFFISKLPYIDLYDFYYEDIISPQPPKDGINKTWENYETITSPGECKYYGGKWEFWSGWQDERQCNMPYPDSGKKCQNNDECLSEFCFYNPKDICKDLDSKECSNKMFLLLEQKVNIKIPHLDRQDEILFENNFKQTNKEQNDFLENCIKNGCENNPIKEDYVKNYKYEGYCAERIGDAHCINESSPRIENNKIEFYLTCLE